MRRASHTVKSPVSGSRRRYYRCRIRNRVRTWHCRALDFREVRGKTCCLPGRLITLSGEFFSVSVKATATSLTIKFCRVSNYHIVSEFCSENFACTLFFSDFWQDGAKSRERVFTLKLLPYPIAVLRRQIIARIISEKYPYVAWARAAKI